MNTKAAFHYDNYYHIYNRTHDGVKLFPEQRNYVFFLQRYKNYLQPFLRIHAYALLGNHFHFSVAVKNKDIILDHVKSIPENEMSKGIRKYLANIENEEAIHDLIISQHQRFFISYSKACNKANNRVGGMFKRPFKHSHFDPELKFKYMQYYLHHNARKHGLVKDFDIYLHTSYHEIVDANDWLIDIDEIWKHWKNKQEFIDFHKEAHYTDQFEGLIIEDKPFF